MGVYTDPIADAARLVDLYLTMHPGYPLEAAVDLICDRDKIEAADRDRVRDAAAARLVLADCLQPARRAAA